MTPRADARRQATDLPTVSGRYTAPVPAEYRHSPLWVPALMLTFFGCRHLDDRPQLHQPLARRPVQLVPAGRPGVHRLRLRHIDAVPLVVIGAGNRL